MERRQVLAAALVGGIALVGCSRSGGHEPDSPSARPGASVAGTAQSATPSSPAAGGAPDAGGPQRGDGTDSAHTAMSSALDAEAALLAAYDATLHRHPTLARTLRPVRAEHAAHLAALRRAATVTGDRAGAGSSNAALPGARATRRPAVPSVPAAAVAALVGAERAAAAARVTDCLAAPRALAPLLASIGASEAAHVPALLAR